MTDILERLEAELDDVTVFDSAPEWVRIVDGAIEEIKRLRALAAVERLTNVELESAIQYASIAVERSTTGTNHYQLLTDHLEAMLNVQLLRARGIAVEVTENVGAAS